MYQELGLRLRSIWRPMLAAVLSLILLTGAASPSLGAAGADAPQELDVTFVVVAGPELGSDAEALASQVRSIGSAINQLHSLRWPATAADGRTPMGGAGQLIGQPQGVIVVGDLTDGLSYPGREGACATSEPGAMTAVRQVFERGFSSAGYNIIYPTYLGLGDRDLDPQGVSAECGRQLAWEYVDSLYAGQAGLSYDSASHAYSWDWGGLHLVQLQRFGGDTRAGQASSLAWLSADLQAAAGRPTILFQHYGWGANASEQACRSGDSDCIDDSGAPCTSGEPGCYRWWSDAERAALDQAIANAQAHLIAAFHGHRQDDSSAPRNGHYTSPELGQGMVDILSVWRPVSWSGTTPTASARFAVVHVTDRYLDLAYVQTSTGSAARAKSSDPAAWLTLPSAYRFTTCYEHAPVLNVRYSPALTTLVASTADPAGDRLADVIPNGAISDPDGAALKAIAVIAADNRYGTWQYRAAPGGAWTAFGSPTASSARLLGPEARVRFIPQAGWQGTATLTFRAWDMGAGSEGGTANTRRNGGCTPFSLATDTASVAVISEPVDVNNPPLLDLDGTTTGSGYSAAFVPGAGPVAIAAASLTLVDIDDAEMAAATVTLSSRPDGAAEVLAADTAGTSIAAAYDPATGVLSLAGKDTIAHYRQVLSQVTYDNTAPHPLPDDRTATFVVSDGSADSNAATSTIRLRAADLRLGMTPSSDPVAAGAELAYTLTVTNDGPGEAAGVVLGDTLPAGLSYLSASASQGSCSRSGSEVTCQLGTLAGGGSATVTLRGRVGTKASGNLSNTARLAAETFDPLAANNSATTSTRVTTLTRLSPDHRRAGSGAFTLTLYGTHFAQGAVVLWNGAARPTTYVSASELRAAIRADDIRRPGTAQVSVANPAPGGTTPALAFTAQRPAPTPEPAVIRLRVELAPGAGISWSELWAAVQWLDGAGAWHDVQGWQGRLEGTGQTWVVASPEFGKGPFRWALLRGRGGALLAVSESFRLPTGPGQAVERLVRVPAPMPTPTPTARPYTPTAAPPTAQPTAAPAQPTPTATPSGTPGSIPTPTLQPGPSATPHASPTVQPGPTPQPQQPRRSLLLAAGAALLGLLLVGVAAGWLWMRGLRS